MMLTRSRARSIGWAVILAVCFGLTIALTFRVNAVKSQVRLTERTILSLRQERDLLETEFETRSNQQQLRALNDLEFGYEAPRAGQYLEGERQLAALGKARGPGAPEMIRVAVAEPAVTGPSFPKLVNPLTGRAMANELPRESVKAAGAAKAGEQKPLVERLSHIEREPKLIAMKDGDSLPGRKAAARKGAAAAE